jgi:phenylalanyl-tRNA synthetase alpha chain
MLTEDLALRDLTDPYAGPHALQQMTAGILAAVSVRWPARLVLDRGDRIVDVADNYDRLGYTAGARTRDARYTRYVSDTRMLRSQTSALIPPVLRRLAATGRHEALIACPGLVYRRDVIDRLHTGTPHQLDLWLLAPAVPDLRELVAAVVGAALPGAVWRANPASHPYTSDGLEVEVRAGGQWVEIGECGHAARSVLSGAGLPAYVHGLALGLGLDRLVMLRKGIPDIRLLRSPDPAVAAQMLDLAPYRPVSSHPAARRDVSVAVRAGMTPELRPGRGRPPGRGGRGALDHRPGRPATGSPRPSGHPAGRGERATAGRPARPRRHGPRPGRQRPSRPHLPGAAPLVTNCLNGSADSGRYGRGHGAASGTADVDRRGRRAARGARGGGRRRSGR